MIVSREKHTRSVGNIWRNRYTSVLLLHKESGYGFIQRRSQKDKYCESESEGKEVRDLLNKVNHDEVAVLMTELLTDEEVQTYDMFENIVDAYESGNEDFRKGMDKMFEILTWNNLDELTNKIRERCLYGAERDNL